MSAAEEKRFPARMPDELSLDAATRPRCPALPHSLKSPVHDAAWGLLASPGFLLRGHSNKLVSRDYGYGLQNLHQVSQIRFVGGLRLAG